MSTVEMAMRNLSGVVRNDTQDAADPKVPMQVAPIRIVRSTVVIEHAHDAPATWNAEIVQALEVHPF